METGELRNAGRLLSSCLPLMFVCSCATPPQTGSAAPVNDSTARGLNPAQIVKEVTDLIDPRQQAYKQAAAAYASLQRKLEEIDVAALNAAVDELHGSLGAIHTKTSAADIESVGRLADEWQESAKQLSASLGTFDRQIASVDTDQLNRALQQTSELAESWEGPGRELQALLTDVRRLLDGIDPQQITKTIEQVQHSSAHLELAAAKLPSTSTSISTTIWLLNLLMAVGITLAVVHLVRLRRSDRRP